MALQTIHGALIDHPNPLRTVITATLVDLNNDPVVGYVSNFVSSASGGEYVAQVITYPDQDGNWSLQLTPNDDIAAPTGMTLWKIVQNSMTTYINVPVSGGPFWIYDIITDPPTGGTVVATYAVRTVNGQTGDVVIDVSGGGAVDSVNGLTGAVELDYSNVGADASGTAASAVAAHSADTTSVHGIADTSALALDSDVTAVADDLVTHAMDTTNVHGIADTSLLTRRPPWVFDVTVYGAVGDAQVIVDGAMTATDKTLTSASDLFTADDVGKSITVKGAAATGITTLVTTIASFTNSGSVELTDAAATTVTGAVVIWGTDDTSAIQDTIDAAETYLETHTYAQVYFPPLSYIVAGALNNTKSGNGQLVFGVYSTSDNKRILEFRGESGGTAAVRHWEQTYPQFAGACLISFGVYSSTTAQTNNINADGNPGVISGPNEGSGYGVNSGGAVFSNVMAILTNLAVLTTHSSFGLTYGAANLWGCANALVDNFGYGTAGTVAGSSTDYTSPGTFGTGLSVGLLLPAPGNNDHSIARNISCGGGYTYALFITEHTVMDRYMALYCWAGLCPIGTYAGSVGSVHGIKVLTASIEACTNEVYIIGAGSGGVGPIIDIDQLSTESSTPNIAGNSSGAMAAALGRIKLTGLFTESGVSVSDPTGIELVNGQVPRAIKRKTGDFTCSPIDRTLICDTSAAGFTGTLPSANFNPVQYVFKNIGANTLTVSSSGSQDIYTTSSTGATTTTLAEGETLRVQALYNGTSWGWYAV